MTATTLLEGRLGADSRQPLPDLFGAREPRRPALRATVRRPRLFAALTASDAPPITVLVAPAGYGKTTLLCEWSARDPRPFAWVTLDRRHDDTRVLLRTVARALDEAGDGRVVLVLDDVHVLRSPEAHAAIAAIAHRLPAEVSVALASRTELPLPVARLRAQGLVSELRETDLAMTRSEASALMKAADAELTRDELAGLLHRTEGWPAGLALAALAVRGETVLGPALARFSGDDRLVAEYVRDEVLSELSVNDFEFVLRTSILDVLTAPLCDAVLARSDSAETLARLDRADFPLVALDRTAQRYRHHRLLVDALRTELGRGARQTQAELHRRASEWHAQTGDGERALRHALAANEIQRAGELVWRAVPNSLEHGASAAVERWLSRFTDAQVAAEPRLALLAAGTQLAYGQGDLAAHWTAVAAAAGVTGELAGGVAALRAALGRDGLTSASEDAERGAALLGPDSVCQALCDLIAGIADHLRDRPEDARRRLERGARRAAVSAPHLHALCLSQLALLALEDGDGEEAARLSTRARSQVARHGLERFPTSALVLAVSALIRAQRGRIDAATDDARDAAALLERLTDLAPWYEAEVQVLLARTALRLSNVNTARERLADASRLATRLSDAPALAGWIRDIEGDLEAFTSEAARLPSSLTAAELRILHYLPTHFSFREIADRTHVSANTVKTQANAVYRKLDVRSRSDAVTCARALGLLDG